MQQCLPRQRLSTNAFPSGIVVACGVSGTGDSVRARWVTLRAGGLILEASSARTLNFRLSRCSTAYLSGRCRIPIAPVEKSATPGVTRPHNSGSVISEYSFRGMAETATSKPPTR
jgi:hypothetical protein